MNLRPTLSRTIVKPTADNAASKLRKLAIDDMPDVKQRKTTLKNASSIFVKKLMNSAFWLKIFTTVMGEV